MAEQNFNHFKEEMEKVLSAAERGMEKATLKFQSDTALLTHVDTGALRRSWTHKVKSDNGAIEGAVGSYLEYAKYEDNKEGHENLTAALNANVGNYLAQVAEEIKNSVGG